MNHQLILIILLAYTLMLFIVGWITSKNADNESFFLNNRKSNWMVVAYGMIGASLSGVTFISIPGWVSDTQFSYMVLVFGYLLGYLVIAKVLLPLYYNLGLTSIYSYLDQRFGRWSYKTGAFYFLVSRLIGASFRIFLVINILQIFVFDKLGIPFWTSAVAFVLLINLYTFRGGIKTIVWTDALQTTFMLASVIITAIFIKDELMMTTRTMFQSIAKSEYSQMIFTNWQDQRFYLKQFFSGAFIAIVMTGLDQDMMQKNLSCRSLKDAQKNIISLSWALIPVNLLFLSLGTLLMIFANTKGIVIPGTSDTRFPEIAFNHLPSMAGIVFVIGLISAAYSSADSAMTALTTSFTVDFLGIKRNPKYSVEKQKKIRQISHFGMALAFIIVIIMFKAINNSAVINELFTIASYTYGPLLGLYAFGLFTKRQTRDRFTPFIAILAPLICYVLSKNSEEWLWGYKFSFELLILNGLLMFLGLMIFSERKHVNK
jgi:Na+/proline symporter